MTNLSRNAQLYVRVLLMRRQVMLRVTATRIALGAVAALFLLGALALANVAAFFWLAPRLGEAGAAAVLAGLQAAVGVIVLVVAVSTSAAPELEALRETEQAALAMLAEEAEGITSLFSPARGADRMARNLSMGIDLATMLVGLLRKKKG